MFAYLKGKIIHKDENSVIIKTGDFGFRIFLCSKELQKIIEGDNVEFFTFEYIREDQRELYGFSTIEELDFFLVLINVPRIGPRLGQNILEHAKVSEIKKAIIFGDPASLIEVSRIGRKTAEKLILELQAKFAKQEKNKAKDSDLEDALKRLGYSQEEIQKVLRKMPSVKDSDIEARLKKALSLLGEEKG